MGAKKTDQTNGNELWGIITKKHTGPGCMGGFSKEMTEGISDAIVQGAKHRNDKLGLRTLALESDE